MTPLDKSRSLRDLVLGGGIPNEPAGQANGHCSQSGGGARNVDSAFDAVHVLGRLWRRNCRLRCRGDRQQRRVSDRQRGRAVGRPSNFSTAAITRAGFQSARSDARHSLPGTNGSDTIEFNATERRLLEDAIKVSLTAGLAEGAEFNSVHCHRNRRRQRKLAFARPLPASGERLRPPGNMEHLIWRVALERSSEASGALVCRMAASRMANIG